MASFFWSNVFFAKSSFGKRKITKRKIGVTGVQIHLYSLFCMACLKVADIFQRPFFLACRVCFTCTEPCTEPQKNSPLCVVWLLSPVFVLWSPGKKLWLFLRFLQALTPSSNPSALQDVKSQITFNCSSSCAAFHALFCEVSSSVALWRKKFQRCPLWPYSEISLTVKSTC